MLEYRSRHSITLPPCLLKISTLCQLLSYLIFPGIKHFRTQRKTFQGQPRIYNCEYSRLILSSRHDRTSDNDFYAAARIVHHIDDAARRSLAQYYDSALPQQGRILDFCSSWVSHYPPRIEQAVAHDKIVVVGMGMNQAELSRNPILSKTILQDLNMDPTIPSGVCGGGAEHELLDASTCVVSIDYLIHPVEVLSSLRERTRLGGIVHLVVSNRCFPTKAVARWLQIDEQERLSMVGDYLYFAGWRDIEVVDVKASHNEGRAGRDQKQGGLGGFMASFGLGHEDPLWVVRGKRTE